VGTLSNFFESDESDKFKKLKAIRNGLLG